MARDETKSKKRTIRKAGPDDDRVVVGSEIGVTLPVGDTTAHLRFSFWSERLAKNSSIGEIRKAAEAVDEFNEAELERRMTKHLRMIRRALNSDFDEEPPKKGKKQQDKVSVRDRAKARIK